MKPDYVAELQDLLARYRALKRVQSAPVEGVGGVMDGNLSEQPWLDIEIEQILFFSSLVDEGECFNPVKFEKIVAVLQKIGVPLLLGEEGQRFARQMQAEAVYFPTEEGQSGFFAFPPSPTRAQVVEELLHYGQHRKVGFKSVSWLEIVQFELEAQERLLKIGVRLNWSEAELGQILRAWQRWQQLHRELTGDENANNA